MKNKRATSSVWTWFGLKRRKVDGRLVQNAAVCCKCSKEIKHSGGTTNLTTHLNRHHPGTLKSSPSRVSSASRVSSPSPVTTTSASSPLPALQPLESRRIVQASIHSFSQSSRGGRYKRLTGISRYKMKQYAYRDTPFVCNILRFLNFLFV